MAIDKVLRKVLDWVNSIASSGNCVKLNEMDIWKMNKRIQELALQAGAKLGPYVHNVSLLQPDGTYKWDEDRHTDTTTMDLEKFAELIVRECAKIAGKAEYSDTWLEPVEDAIKKHFGVEE